MRRSLRTTRQRAAVAGYHLTVRLAGTAIICILAAFGAAFLVARAVNRETPARAATPPVKPTRVADAVTHPSVTHAVNVELVSQFAPLQVSLKPKPKPKPKPKKHKPKSPASVTPVAPASTTPTYTAPVYSAPTTPAPTPTHPSGSPHHQKRGGSSGGSGTTTIGG
jgi:hypothetical protein